MRVRTVLTTIAVLGLATSLSVGCGSDSPSPGASGPQVTGTADASPTGVSLPTNGQCVLIPTSVAATLIGAAPTSSAAALSGDGDGPVHIDGCTHTSPAGNLGYTINDLAGAGVEPATIVQQASMAVGAAPGAQEFAVPGGDAAVGFTMPVGPKVMARIEIAKAHYTIGVNAVFSDGGKAKQVALDAAAILVAAVS